MREPVWCVFPAPDITTYKFFLDKGVIGVGITDFGDIRKLYPDRESLKQEWMRRYPDMKPKSIDPLSSIVYRFANEVHIGDWVLYPSTKIDRMVHVGRVTGDYTYNSGRSSRYKDLRTVQWDRSKSLPRESFSKEALRGISVNLALFQVRSLVFLAELEAKITQR